MPSIVIREIDNTSAGFSAENVNVVYVPGFSNNLHRHAYYASKDDYDAKKVSYIQDLFYYESDPDFEPVISGLENVQCYNPKEKAMMKVVDYLNSSEDKENHLKAYNTLAQKSYTIKIGSKSEVTSYVSQEFTFTLTVDAEAYDCSSGYYRTEIILNLPEGLNISDLYSSNVTVSFNTACSGLIEGHFMSNCDNIELHLNYSDIILVFHPGLKQGIYYATYTPYEGSTQFIGDVSSYTISKNVPVIEDVPTTICIADTVYNAPISINSPILCTSEDTFVKKFGSTAYTFKSAQQYPAGFNLVALPGESASASIRLAGQPDLGYVLAREISHLGMSVLFENVANLISFGDSTDDISKELVKSGVTAANAYVIAEPSVQFLYDRFKGFDTNGVDDNPAIDVDTESLFEKLTEKGQYSVKYITSGGYPTFEYDKNSVVTKMLSVAAERGDCVAIIDHTYNFTRPVDNADSKSVYYTASNSESGDYNLVNVANLQFGTMFTPWATYATASSMGLSDAVVNLPASFGYLTALAKSIQTNSDWLAIAGVTRGTVPNIKSLSTSKPLTNTIADNYQRRNGELSQSGISINAITEIKPYGLTLWGNRTLFNNIDNLTASSFLNIRNLTSNVKKIVFETCQKLMFEQNNDVLWVNFQASITPTLDQMLTGYGISNYKILKGKFNSTTGQLEQPNEKAKLFATIKLYPLYAVEDFDVTVVLTDEEVSVQ